MIFPYSHGPSLSGRAVHRDIIIIICKEIQTDVKLLSQQMDTLKVEKSMGDDDIAAKKFKIAGPLAAPGLTGVIDKSLQGRKYPKQWKKLD